MTSQGPAVTPDAVAAAQIQQALAKLLRWTSHRTNRELLYGSSAQLSQNEVWLLDAVASAGRLRLSDLALWQGVDKSTVTPQVRRLEDKGLLRRTDDPTDRRAVLLLVTARGRALQRRRAQAGTALIDALLHSWPARERAAFATLFARFADQLGDTTP